MNLIVYLTVAVIVVTGVIAFVAVKLDLNPIYAATFGVLLGICAVDFYHGRGGK